MGREARATWYSENVEDGADIVLMDLRWPWWPSGTYFANWNSSFNPKPNNLSFYAGFTSYVPDGPGQTPHPDALRQDGFRPGSVWTFWGSDVAGTPVRFTDVAPNLYIKNDYGGEGSSGTGRGGAGDTERMTHPPLAPAAGPRRRGRKSTGRPAWRVRKRSVQPLHCWWQAIT
jgi:hypothetical protein